MNKIENIYLSNQEYQLKLDGTIDAGPIVHKLEELKDGDYVVIVNKNLDVAIYHSGALHSSKSVTSISQYSLDTTLLLRQAYKDDKPLNISDILPQKNHLEDLEENISTLTQEKENITVTGSQMPQKRKNSR